MAIKIWHQSFTVLSDLAAYDDALRAHFKRVARPDTEIVQHGLKPGTYRTNYPGDDIKHAAFLNLHGLQFISAAVQAEREGFDAFALSTLPEPGLRDIRSLVDIPVVGYGESAMLQACLVARRFGVLVFIPELAELVTANAHRYGLADRFIAARDVGFRFNDVLTAFSSPASLLERFRESARKLIADGAEAIIPGEAPLTVLLAMNGVTEVDGAPVIDSLGAWVRDAEKLVDMRRAGMQRNRRGYFDAPVNRERRDEILRFYGLN
jgi:Asp/Glu/hydantoin racemase